MQKTAAARTACNWDGSALCHTSAQVPPPAVNTTPCGVCCAVGVPACAVQMLYLGMCGRCGEDADKFFSIKPRRRKGDRKLGELQDRWGGGLAGYCTASSAAATTTAAAAAAYLAGQRFTVHRLRHV